MSIRTIERSGDTTQIVIGEVLTQDDVGLIRNALAGADHSQQRVTVDLRDARIFKASGLLALSLLIAESPGSLVFLGLTTSKTRLLTYLELLSEDRRHRRPHEELT